MRVSRQCAVYSSARTVAFVLLLCCAFALLTPCDKSCRPHVRMSDRVRDRDNGRDKDGDKGQGQKSGLYRRRLRRVIATPSFSQKPMRPNVGPKFHQAIGLCVPSCCRNKLGSIKGLFPHLPWRGTRGGFVDHPRPSWGTPGLTWEYPRQYQGLLGPSAASEALSWEPLGGL